MYLLFYKGTKAENPRATLWDRIICLVTGSRFSHVELSFVDNDPLYLCWSSSTRDKGVRCANIDIRSGHWELVPLDINTSDEWFIQHKGKSYDYVGLIGTIIKLPFFSSKNKWFCSEIIAEFLGLPSSWKYTPEDLYRNYK